MNVSAIKSQVAADLPNFPAEIVEEWIGYYAETVGWPPPTPLTGRWLNLLANHPFEYWKDLVWKKEDLSPLVMPFTYDCADLMEKIVGTHTNNQDNNYSRFMGAEGRERFYRIMRFLASNGTFPKPPIVLLHENGFEIMDGNHRIAAYLAWSQMRHQPQVLETLRETSVPLQDKVPFWVGKSPNNRFHGAASLTRRP